MSDTPKYWKKYLEYLEAKYEKDLDQWEKDSIAKMEEYQARPWYQKIMQSEDDIKMYNEWDKPEKSYDCYKPTIVGYYNWDVNERKKKNVRA